MSRVVIDHRVDAAGLVELRTPRDDLVLEHSVNQNVFALAEGPFRQYERRIELIEPAEQVIDDRLVDARETIEFKMGVPLWGWLLTPAVRREFRRERGSKMAWWAPQDRLDQQSARAFGYLCVVALIAGYLGTLLSQTISFAADEFDADRTLQGGVTSLTRAGALLSLGFVALADRRGRRLLLLISLSVGIVFTVATAAMPSIWAYGATQTVARGGATAVGILVGVAAAEETPRGSRAYIISVLALFAGLGSGMVVWLVPLTDLGVRAWRLLFLAPVLALLPLAILWRHLPETRRFERLEARASTVAAVPLRAWTPENKRRLRLLALTAFATALFAGPSSNFQTEYLKDVRGFSGGEVSIFSLITNTPVGIGVFIGGWLADRRGRRVIGAIGITAGVVFALLRYSTGGGLMWLAGGFGTIIGSMAIPALGVYGPELFGTANRGRANGLITIVAVVGSVVGLTFIGWWSDRYSFGSGFALIALFPLVAAYVVWRRYPETANLSLEEINPEDDDTL